MPANATAITSLRLMSEGGRHVVPADSGTGGLYRPFATGQSGSRTASLETLYDFWINNVPDPSEALAMDPDLRTKLRMHPDVVAAMRKREKTVSSFPWRIEANPLAKDQATAKKVAEYCSGVWQRLPSIKNLYEQMQSAVIEGGIGVEWVWVRDPRGFERPANFFPVHKSRFLFDRLGNMALKTRDTPVWGSYVATAPDGEHVQKGPPAGKFMYHCYRRTPGTWERPDLEGYLYYGEGEEIGLYYPVTFDIFVIRSRMKFLEKWGDPPVDIYHAESRPVGELRRIASSVRGESVVTVPMMTGPEGKNRFYEVVQREAPKASFDMFERFTDGYAKKRIDAILLGDAGESGGGDDSSGYSDKVARQDAGPQIWFRSDAQDISDTINAQLMPSICRNGPFPNLPAEYVPLHKLAPKEEKDLAANMEIVEKAAAFVAVSADYVYEASGIPKPKAGDPTIGGPGSPLDPAVQAQQKAAQLAEANGQKPGEKPGMPGKPGQPGAAGKPQVGPKPPQQRNGIGGGLGNGGGSVAKGGAPVAKTRTMPREGM